jgi:glucoamylase
MNNDIQQAPGAPGIPPRWTSSAKSGVGTALNLASRVWFTTSHGIFDEIYYPRVDQACVRDMGFIITDGVNFFSEEKRDARYQVEYLAEGVPAYTLTNTDNSGRYRIQKVIFTDPHRDVVLQKTRFEALKGNLGDYHLHVLLAPHLGNQGAGNTAWVGDYKGNAMLFAQRDGMALALASSIGWVQRSAGYVGSSDGWQDLKAHKQMTWNYSRAENGNVALTGEIELAGIKKKSVTFILALGFGLNPSEAGQRALASLLEDFDEKKNVYVGEWKTWQKKLLPLETADRDTRKTNLYRTSTAVMRVHEAKRFPGGLIASLAVPWGFAKGDEDLGGYHLVWPRDLVEVAGGLLAAGAKSDSMRVLEYLQVTQEQDGHWPQNMWLDGRPYWNGIQMDETAFPILLVDLARREGAISSNQLSRFWEMVRRAAGFIVCNGPVTQQDRWEEDPGYSPFTLAVEIAALLAAADMAELHNEPNVTTYLRETADTWNDNIERWTYVSGTDLAQQMDVNGYYVRIAPPDIADSATLSQGFVPIKNRPPAETNAPATHIVSPDALALVRFGLRAADDEHVINTVKVIDKLLKLKTPKGDAWHRYDDDGYGEHEDGSPFDGTGIGRAWPLLTGERAHYELASGRSQQARKLLKAMEAFTNDGGMLPEQIWDSPDIPGRELTFGCPSGSAMPLVWAHAEYVKLSRSVRDGRVFDMPPQTVERYLKAKTKGRRAVWKFNQKCKSIRQKQALRIETLMPAVVHWSTDDWQSVQDLETSDSGLGMHIADLDTTKLVPGTKVSFTLYWPAEKRWEGVNYMVEIEAAA